MNATNFRVTLGSDKEITKQMKMMGLEYEDGFWYNKDKSERYSIDTIGRVSRYMTVAEQKKQGIKNTPPSEEYMRATAICLICGEKQVVCKHTKDDIHKHFMNDAKQKIEKRDKMESELSFTEAAMRKRNVLIALEIGYSFDNNNPELMAAMDEYNGRPVKVIVDFRDSRKKPEPIKGVRWGVYTDTQNEYIGYTELNDIVMSSLYKENRNNLSYLPEQVPGVQNFIVVDDMVSGGKLITLAGHSVENWSEFSIIDYSNRKDEKTVKKVEESPQTQLEEDVKQVNDVKEVVKEVHKEPEIIDVAPTPMTISIPVKEQPITPPMTMSPMRESSLVSGSMFDDMMKQAEVLVKSGLLPVEVKTAPAALAIIMTGHELGIPVMQSFRSIYIVKGKPTLSAQLIGGLIFKHGHKYIVKENTAEQCTLEFIRNGEKGVEYTFTMADAKNAGLTGNDVWKKYPKAMLFSRCMSAGARVVMPDIISGLYITEEIADNIDFDPVSGEQKPLEVK